MFFVDKSVQILNTPCKSKQHTSEGISTFWVREKSEKLGVKNRETENRKAPLGWVEGVEDVISRLS